MISNSLAILHKSNTHYSSHASAGWLRGHRSGPGSDGWLHFKRWVWLNLLLLLAGLWSVPYVFILGLRLQPPRDISSHGDGKHKKAGPITQTHFMLWFISCLPAFCWPEHGMCPKPKSMDGCGAKAISRRRNNELRTII